MHATPRIYTRANSADFAYIGMPVGGIGAGQLYIAGDGRLWWWDIFNTFIPPGQFPVEQGAAYMHPPRVDQPSDERRYSLALGFAVKIHAGNRAIERPLDQSGFRDITFEGEYPVAHVTYRDASIPVEIALRAMSPFVPLDVASSSLPATMMRFTVTNWSAQAVDVTLYGWLQNGVMIDAPVLAPRQRNEIAAGPGLTFLNCRMDAPALAAPVVFEDWRDGALGRWEHTGNAFRTTSVTAAAPAATSVAPSNSVTSAGAGADPDGPTGRLLSRPFTIDHSHIDLRLAGGSRRAKTAVSVLIGGKRVRTIAGRNTDDIEERSIDVREFMGKTARLEIIDDASDSWGHVTVGRISFVDRPLTEAAAFGTMGLGLLGAPPEVADPTLDRMPFADGAAGSAHVGRIGRTLNLPPGTSANVDFVLTWYFPNAAIPKIGNRRAYAERFDSALAVARYVADHARTLRGETERWSQTWNDSTLPAWFLDRTFANVSTLATSTSYLMEGGRYYAYEGVYSCPGTCAHVYQYAQAAARLFPSLERDVRARVDLGVALQHDAPRGVIEFRGEYGGGFAVDAQAGTLLRIYREHLMSPDDSFLRREWDNIKLAYEPLFALDRDGDGILEGEQMNTLDKPWYGEIAWLSGLYVAAVRAGEQMALVCHDDEFARRCHEIAERGYVTIPQRLYNGAYFINRVDLAHPESINSGTGSEIDQVLGQSWAFQVGLPRVLPAAQTRSALAALMRFNFIRDAGAYRTTHPDGRWFGAKGDAGMLVCAFPDPKWDYHRAAGKGPKWATGYFNEFMTGMEHQVAAHLLWEGMVPEALAVERAIDDRYAAAKRNPWNEVECGSHYGRAMASYGVFLAACGYEYDGPRGHLGFAPRLSPENFRAAFTAAEGWGSFQQVISGGVLGAHVMLKWGRLRLRSLSLVPGRRTTHVTATLNGRALAARVDGEIGRATISFDPEVTLAAGDDLRVELR